MRVDIHLHAYADASVGLSNQATYPIVEYGDKPGVHSAGVAGTVPEALDAMDAAGIDYAALLGSFELPDLPFPPDGARHWPTQPTHPEFADDLIAYNRWICEVGAEHPRLLPFVTANPAALSSAQARDHLDEAFGDWGARGVKLHPISIRTYVDDPAMTGVYEACERAGVPIVFHSGPDRRGYGWSNPEVFPALAAARPELTMILAHLGGASWRDAHKVAESSPGLYFDVSEIVQWVGAPNAPSADELAALIRTIGVGRVLLGSDFPWYEPGDTIAAVEELPGLTSGERAAILGENAARLLALP